MRTLYQGWFSVLLLSSCISGLGNAQEALKPPLSFEFTPESITKQCDAAIAKSDEAFMEIVKVSGPRTYENTLLPYDQALAILNEETTLPTFLFYVAPDELLRNSAEACQTKLDEYLVKLLFRDDLFAAIKNYSATSNANLLDGEPAKLLADTLKTYRRSGIDLPEAKRKEVERIQTDLVGLQTAFTKNVNEWDEKLAVTEAELVGVPDVFVRGLTKDAQGRYLLEMSADHYQTFAQNAKDENARRNFQKKYENRGHPNVPIFEKILKNRGRLAQLLGYSTFAEYTLDANRMARKPEEVRTLLGNVQGRLIPLRDAELARMLEMKRAENPQATQIGLWDWRYYDNQMKLQDYNINSQEIRQYFPVDVVMPGMFRIYQTLLGVQFEEVNSPLAWAPDVKLYAVKNNTNGDVIGFFYMDLYPRKGKYKHFANFGLLPGYRQSDGAYRTPICSIVGNFPAPTADAPSLLTHSDVETLFHEFGHSMHHLLAHTELFTYGGSSVYRDFVEAPSQMLENWVWNKETLQLLSGHYQDHERKLPDETLQRMIQAKNLNVGIKTMRQIFFASIDLDYHTQQLGRAAGKEKLPPTTALWSVRQRELFGVDRIPGTHPEASFTHLAGGYAAGYYGYLWSEVFAADMFTRFEKEGLLNPSTGSDYRRIILQPGGSLEPSRMLEKFLGRAPTIDAYLRGLGVQ